MRAKEDFVIVSLAVLCMVSHIVVKERMSDVPSRSKTSVVRVGGT